MANNHHDNITVSISLGPAPLQVAGFGVAMFVAAHATSTLGGDRSRLYTGVSGLQTDVDAGELSTVALAAGTAAFSQTRKPASIMIGRTDAADTDIAATLAAIEVDNAAFYGICLEDRTEATQVALGTAVEAMNRLFFYQSASADWRTSGVPAAYSTLAGNERSVVTYHDTATVWGDFAWLANRLTFDPDTQSAPWDCAVQGVSAIGVAPTDTQKAFLDANFANHGLPNGGDAYWIDAGVNMAGRSIHEIVTLDWFKARLQEAIISVKTAASARGDKIPITAEGQGLILAQILALFERGVTAGHFVAGETEAAAVTIVQADYDLSRMRFTGRAQLVSGWRSFDFNFDFSRTALYA